MDGSTTFIKWNFASGLNYISHQDPHTLVLSTKIAGRSVIEHQFNQNRSSEAERASLVGSAISGPRASSLAWTKPAFELDWRGG